MNDNANAALIIFSMLAMFLGVVWLLGDILSQLDQIIELLKGLPK